jgi:predicted nucleotidyltransferase component of viral defense system
MQSIIKQMLNKYEIKTVDDKTNAIKEVIQEIILCGLSRAGFFKQAAFYGGTALRIFYGLDRFSEDLDFTLITPNQDFDLNQYTSILMDLIHSIGLNCSIETVKKVKDSPIKSTLEVRWNG